MTNPVQKAPPQWLGAAERHRRAKSAKIAAFSVILRMPEG